MSCFGLEAKVAYLLQENSSKGDECVTIRKVFYRLAQEPIIYSYWNHLRQSPLAVSDMLSLASMLNGAAVTCRLNEMTSFLGADDGHLLYETVDQCKSWSRDIADLDDLPGDPIKKALYRFARIIMAHPFTDANGRFARAALQGGLGRYGRIATPCLALAPTFYWKAAEIRNALIDLSDSGAWETYFSRMGEILDRALVCVGQLTIGRETNA